MHQKIYINSNKSIREKCLNWASSNTPKGIQIVSKINNCDIFISVKYDKILDSKFLESRCSYNFHPNILPNYASVSTLTHSILNGEKYVRVTSHKIDSGLETKEKFK